MARIKNTKNLSKKQKEMLEVLRQNGIMLESDDALEVYFKNNWGTTTAKTLYYRGLIIYTEVFHNGKMRRAVEAVDRVVSCEIEKAPKKVAKENLPFIEHHNDVRDCNENDFKDCSMFEKVFSMIKIIEIDMAVREYLVNPRTQLFLLKSKFEREEELIDLDLLCKRKRLNSSREQNSISFCSIWYLFSIFTFY
jgi:hypothetical protein